MTVRKVLVALAGSMVLAMTAKHDGHRKHWWWDNVNHFVGGFAVGMMLPDGKERSRLLVICAGWEAFEYALARAKLYETFDSVPEAPRSLGYEGWEFDHQMEDTVLDTVMAYQGMKVAKRVKEVI